MNFRESYKKEMDGLEKPSDITERVLNTIDAGQDTFVDKKGHAFLGNGAIWKTAAIVIAIVCVVGLGVQHKKVISFAKSAISGFNVTVNGEDMEFGEIEAVEMDVEGFMAYAGGGEVLDPEAGRSYYHFFDSYQEMNEITQLEFPGADEVEYRDVYVDITPTYKTGHINAQILHEGVSYNVSGMFTLNGFRQESWGYGASGSKEIYKYGDGKKACFLKDSDGYEKVYFEEGNILFQMHFNTGGSIEDGAATATKKQAKKLLKLFGKKQEQKD